MGNLALVSQQLQLRQPGQINQVLLVVGPDDVDFGPAPGGGTVGPGTIGAVAVFSAANVVSNTAPGVDTTFNVPVGQVGVFAINGVSLVRLTAAGFSPTVNAGVASGDASHVWANVYGRNVVSDTILGIDAATGQYVVIRNNGLDVVRFPAPTVPTTWTWPVADVAGVLQSNGAGTLTFGPVGGGWTIISKTADQSSAIPGNVNDNTLVTPSLAPGKWRVQVNMFFGAAGAGGFGCTLAVPASTFLRCHNINQAPSGGSLASLGNIGTTVPAFSNGNTGEGWMSWDLIIVVSVAGVVQVTFDSQNGGNTATIYAGSYLQYAAA